MDNVFDCRVNAWGHTIEQRWGQDDPCKVHGCLTPLPQEGDFAIAANDMAYRFISVTPSGNPKDAFKADVAPTDVHLIDEGDGLPTHKEITDFITNNP